MEKDIEKIMEGREISEDLMEMIVGGNSNVSPEVSSTCGSFSCKFNSCNYDMCQYNICFYNTCDFNLCEFSSCQYC
jgi:hypothetical protein